MKGGALYIKRCRRQCIEAPRGKNFSPSFFTSQDGLSWHLRAFALQVAGPRAAMSFFLGQISLTNVICTYTYTYTEGYTRSWSRSQAVRFQATHGKLIAS